jgi:hypothetical protein
LFCALWARSYRSKDILFGPLLGTQIVAFESLQGRVHVRSYNDPAVSNWAAESWGRQTRRFASDTPRGYLFSVPHWLFVIAAGTIGVAPLASRWRNGLRNLFLAFAILSVAWAVVVAFNHRALLR